MNGYWVVMTCPYYGTDDVEWFQNRQEAELVTSVYNSLAANGVTYSVEEID